MLSKLGDFSDVRVEALDDHAGRPVDAGEVRLLGLGVRRRDADDHRVDFGQDVRVGRGAEAPRRHLASECVTVNVLNVGDTLPNRPDFAVVDVEADDGEARLSEGSGERQTDIAQAKDGHAGRRDPDLLGQFRPGNAQNCGFHSSSLRAGYPAKLGERRRLRSAGSRH